MPESARQQFASFWRFAVVLTSGLLVAAGCGSSGSSTAANASGAGNSSSSPGAKFSTASVAGLGTVLVDGRRHTVYVLTTDRHTNLPCEDSTGCTKTWPDLPFPNGVSSATAGSGIDPSKLSSQKLSDGQTYPTYNHWLLYEYVGDSGPALGGGEGITSFGGTWYALNASGDPVLPGSTSNVPTSSGNGY